MGRDWPLTDNPGMARECPSFSRNRALALANFAGVSRSGFGFFDYPGRPGCRLHRPRAERMRENIPVTPSA
jgi:hypothetical protein